MVPAVAVLLPAPHRAVVVLIPALRVAVALIPALRAAVVLIPALRAAVVLIPALRAAVLHTVRTAATRAPLLARKAIQGLRAETYLHHARLATTALLQIVAVLLLVAKPPLASMHQVAAVSLARLRAPAPRLELLRAALLAA